MHSVPDPSSFDISPDLGFISASAPLKTFQDEYYKPWDDAISDLPSLIETGQLYSTIARLPLLQTTNLKTDPDYRRAYVVLGFLVHAYVWSTTPPTAKIAAQLSEPFLEVCAKLRMEPVLSYAGLCIWNWKLTSSTADFDLEHMETLASFTGDRQEAAFYHVPVLVEREGGALMHRLVEAVSAAAKGENSVVVEALRETARAIVTMGEELMKLYSTLEARFFYHELRPFLAGGRGMEEKGLPDGMVFSKDDGTEVKVKAAGGSAVQSSLFPFLDRVLGISHQDGDVYEVGMICYCGERFSSADFCDQDMLNYMPGAHRDFLNEVSDLPSLRSYVESNMSDDDLREAYDDCMKKARAWRGKHIAIVSKYIVQPAREAMNAAKVDKLEMGSEEKEDEWEIQGTGGSALIPFLRQARDETIGVER